MLYPIEEFYDNLYFTHTRGTASYDSNKYNNISPDMLLSMGLCAGAVFLTLWLFSWIFSQVDRKVRTVFIMRELPSTGTRDLTLQYIRDRASVPYKIYSLDNNSAKEYRILLRKYIRRLYTTDDDIYIVSENFSSIDYNPFIDLAERNGYKTVIIEFASESTNIDNKYRHDPRTFRRIHL